MNTIHRLFCVLGLLFFGLSSQAQAPQKGIPNEVYYLMPQFGQGYIYFRGQAPAQGKLNICAVDNTLRFLDKNGQELEASGADNILKVQIDTAVFLRHQDIYYRLTPVTPDMGVATRREVKILTDVKEAGYGTTSQTSSIRSYNTIYADGAIYNLEEGKTYPYEVSETVFLYKGDTVFSLSKKNLRKLFPAKKDQIDAYFKEGHPVPETLPDALSLLRSFAD